MLENHNFDDILEQNEKKIRELENEIESLNRDIKECFEKIGLKPEELEAFFANPDNFTSEGWEILEQERKRLDAELQKKMDHIRDPVEAKKRYASRNIPPYAIFVR